MPFTRPHHVPVRYDSICEDTHHQLEAEILYELLRQARYSYNLALAITIGSALITLAGIGLLYLDKIPAASVTTAGGALASIRCIEFAKESKEELRQMMEQREQLSE